MLLGLLALVKAAGYWLQRFELTVSTRGFVDGASYTDVKAQLPAINLLLLISLAALRAVHRQHLAAGLGPAGPRPSGSGRSSPWWPAAIYPAVRPAVPGRRRTSPGRSARTSSATSRRRARRMGLGRRRASSPFDLNDGPRRRSTSTANADDGRATSASGTRARSCATTFQQLQARARLLPVQRRRRRPLRARRRADPGGAVGPRAEHRQRPADSRGTASTSPTPTATAPSSRRPTRRTPSGEPDFVAEDVPVRQPTRRARRSTQPGVYFGEDLDGYVVVGTKQRRARLPGRRAATQYTTVRGRRTASRIDYLVQPGRVRPALRRLEPADLDQHHRRARRSSTSATSGSGCETLAPFLHFDADPYPVILDGRIQWVARRLHDHRPLPVRAAGRHRRSSPTAAGSTTRSTTCATR